MLIHTILIILILFGVGLIILKSTKGGWKTYSNARFGYSVDYPTNWKESTEAENGDGKPLYRDDENEILVYASNMPSNFSNLGAGSERRNITLKDGRPAIELKNLKGKTSYIVYFNDSGRQYVFYAQVTQDFFNKNISDMKASASSLRVIE